MKKSTIKIEVTLDDQSIPEKIVWQADDSKDDESNLANAINLSFWDGEKRETMKMDLWTKQMPAHEMKMFYVDMIGSLSESLLNATGDEEMSKEIKALGEKLMSKLESEFKS